MAAAVLRGAYLTHFDPAHPEKMAVNLSSARVRTASSLLDGVRNGQELGALLGYQFERGLHDGHGDPSLNQYIPLFRAQYPLLADKITPDESGSPIETKGVAQRAGRLCPGRGRLPARASRWTTPTA